MLCFSNAEHIFLPECPMEIYYKKMYLPDKDADIILGTTIARKRVYACSQSNFIVNLNKARAKEIIATSGLISIALS